MRKIWKMFMLSTSVFVLLVLAACSSGTSTPTASNTVSGVAAAGAPIIGFAYLKDSTGTTKGPITLAADGSFTFDVTGLTPPFLLQAQGAAGGQSFTLHSVATATGTANINPLTNLIVAQASGGKDPAAVFGSVTGNAAPDLTNINQASVNAAITAIQTALAPLLQAAQVTDASTNSSFDPIKVAYVADSTKNKLDALFDAVTIAVAPPAGGTPATVTVADKSSGTTIMNATATAAAVTAATNTVAATANTTIAAAAQTASDSQQVVTFLKRWADTVNTKGVNLTAADLEPFYVGSSANPAPFKRQDGYTRTQIIADLVSNLTGKIIPKLGQCSSVSNFGIVLDVTRNNAYLDTNSNPLYNKVYRIRADFIFQDGSYGSPGHLTVAQATAGGPWLFIGDAFKADVDIRPYANQTFLADGTTVYKTGLEIYLEDVGNLGVNSASLEGPGLPADGVTLSKLATGNGSATRLALDSPFWSSQNGGDMWSQLVLTDTQIGQIVPATPNQYTLKFYSSPTAPTDRTTGLMQTLHPIINARPVLSTELSSGMFGSASIAGLTHQLLSVAAMVGNSTSFTYTLPTKYVPAWANISVDAWSSQQAGGNVYFNQQLRVDKTAGSFLLASLSTNITPTNGQLGFEVEDPAHRYFRTYWLLN